MTTRSLYTGDGTVITYNTVDMEFEFEGKTTYMEVHKFYGPTFYTLDEDGGEQWIDADDQPRYDSLWEVYEDWVNNKCMGYKE